MSHSVSSGESNYPNLYEILEETQTEMKEEKQALDLEEERKAQKARIIAAEERLLSESGTFLPAIEDFLQLLAQRFDIQRPKKPEVKSDPPSQDSKSQDFKSKDFKSKDLKDTDFYPSFNPEFQNASAPTSEFGDYSSASESGSSWIEEDSAKEQEKKLEKMREKVREDVRKEMRETRKELREIRHQAKEDRHDRDRYMWQRTTPRQAPVVINNNNNNNNNKNAAFPNSNSLNSLGEIGVLGSLLGHGMSGKIIEESKEERAKKEERREKEKEERKRAREEQDETLTRILSALVALGFGAWGAYEFARESGKEVCNEELDIAATKASEVLTTHVRLNNVLYLSELYQNLDKCVSIWRSYRTRYKKHCKNLSYFKKMTVVPLVGAAASRALLPFVWKATGVGATQLMTAGFGFGLVLSYYGALNWIYEHTHYYFAYSKGDEWEKSEISRLVTSIQVP